MERISKDNLNLVVDDFCIAGLTRVQFNNIPSLKGIKLYEGIDLEGLNGDYICFYSRHKLINKNLEFNEEGYYEDPNDGILYPDFYMRNYKEG